eukprot:183919-Prorocentrum_minimum.AAC.2
MVAVYCPAIPQDEFYHRYLTKNSLFEPVIDAFVSNGERYNLLNSSVIEMVDFIRRENIKSLIVHLMENFGSKFENITYVETFQELKIRYEQLQEGRGMQLPPGTTAPEALAGAARLLPQAAGPGT